MFAYLVAGLIMGGLAWLLRRMPGALGLLSPLVVGTLAGGVGGTLANLVHGADFDSVDAFGFTTAVLAALLALAWTHARRTKA